MMEAFLITVMTVALALALALAGVVILLGLANLVLGWRR